MIKPGVYTEVRAEGLAGVGALATGVIGVVGTAKKGAVESPITVANLNQAINAFGLYDAYNSTNEGKELSLTRAIELMFASGAGTIIAVRAADSSVASGTLTLASASGNCVVLTAASPGTWGNLIGVEVEAAVKDALIYDEHHTGVTANQTSTWWTLDHAPIVDARTQITTVLADGTERTYTIIWVSTGGGSAGPAGTVTIEAVGATTPGKLWFNGSEIPPSTATLHCKYVVGSTNAVLVTLTDADSGAIEEYTVADGNDLIYKLAASSALCTGTTSTYPTEKPTTYSGTKTLSGGNNGTASLAATDVEDALNKLATETVNFVVMAGQPVSSSSTTMYAKLLAHVTTTATSRKERIGLIGHIYADDTLSEVKTTAGKVGEDNGRIVFVSPGIKMTNRVTGTEETVGAAYTAAAVAGLLASLRPNESPTNKTVSVSDLQLEWNYGEHEQLIENRVCALETLNGFRVVKGITASSGSFVQITTRRIVDYCLAGCRQAAQQFIGKLNNARVRGACKVSLAGFLDRMLRDEYLIPPYELEVSATRSDEIAGIAYVDLLIRPVFSIDYIHLVMTLA